MSLRSLAATEIGAFVRRYRVARHLTQAALATQIPGWHQATVWSVESGSRPLLFAEAVELSTVLSFDLDDLAEPVDDLLPELREARVFADVRSVVGEGS